MTTVERRSATGRWLRCVAPRPAAQARLVCFPHAGGSASFYRLWSRQLPGDIEVIAVQYPGRLDRLREPRIEDVHELAEIVSGELGGHLDRPLGLFGHSMGAAVAYETANRLHQRQALLRALFVSSHPAPGRPHRNQPAHLSDDQLLLELRRLGATPSDVTDNPELTELVLPSLRSDYRAVGRYRPRPGPRLTCPVIGLVGDNDPDVPADDMGDWAGVTDDAFALIQLPGDHFYLVPQLRYVLDEVRRRLIPADRHPASPSPRRID